MSDFMGFYRLKKLFALVFILLILFPLPLSLPNKAEAQFGEIGTALANCFLPGGIGGAITSLISGASSSFGLEVPVGDSQTRQSTGSLEKKESCLDGISFAAAKLILRQMTQSIVNWINSGFQGEPLFLSNPEQFFGDIANREVNLMILETQRQASVYAQEVAVSLVRKKRKPANLGDSIAQACLNQRQTAESPAEPPPPLPSDDLPVGFKNPSPYIAGDYTMRLEREERRLAEAASPSFWKSVSLGAKKTLAAASFGLLAQETAPPDVFGQSDITDLEEGDTLEGEFQSNPCPTTPGEQQIAIQKCLNGETSFSECGGVGGLWYPLTQNQENNVLGAVLSAQSEAAARQQAALDQARLEVAANQGFISQGECIPDTEIVDDDGNFVSCTREIVTPGIVAAGAAQEITATSFRQAELVKEFNEAVSLITTALINQLANQGFAYLSRDGGPLNNILINAGQAALTEINAERQFQENVIRNIERTLEDARRYAATKKFTITALKDVVTLLSTLKLTVYDPYCPATYARAVGDFEKIPQYTAIANSYDAEAKTLEFDIASLEKILNEARSLLNFSSENNASMTTLANQYGQIASRLPNSGNVSQAEGELGLIEAKKAEAGSWKAACESEAQRPPST